MLECISSVAAPHETRRPRKPLHEALWAAQDKVNERIDVARKRQEQIEVEECTSRAVEYNSCV